MDFKDKLLSVRAKLNLSQSELAEKLNVTYVTICRWECGKVMPTKRAECAFDQFCQDNGITFKEEK